METGGDAAQRGVDGEVGGGDGAELRGLELGPSSELSDPTGGLTGFLRRCHGSQHGRRSNAGEQLLDARLPATAESKGKCSARMAECVCGGLKQLSGFKAELRCSSRDAEVRLVLGGAEARRGRATRG